jgi:acyl carrier protein
LAVHKRINGVMLVEASLQEKILAIIQSKISYAQPLEWDDSMEKIGMDSMTYIKVIVELEKELDVEFDDDYLDLESFFSVGELVLAAMKLVDLQGAS